MENKAGEMRSVRPISQSINQSINQSKGCRVSISFRLQLGVERKLTMPMLIFSLGMNQRRYAPLFQPSIAIHLWRPCIHVRIAGRPAVLAQVKGREDWIEIGLNDLCFFR
jgi:hypothetical protein